MRHGAGWNFILWGFLHGCYPVLYRVYESRRMAHRSSGSSPILAGAVRFLTLTAVTAAWVPFRSPRLHKTGEMLGSMFLRFRTARDFDLLFYLFTLGVALFCVVESFLLAELQGLEERSGENGPALFRIFFRPVAYLIGLLLFVLFGEHNAEFIYSQF